MVTIFGDMRSQPCRTVVQFCRLNNIPFQFEFIDLLMGKNMQGVFAKKFPTMKVPALIHENFQLIESFAIIKYLGEVFSINSQWWPADISKRSKINSMLHWHHSNIRENFQGLFFEWCVWQKIRMNEPNVEEESRLRTAVETTLQVLNRELEIEGDLAGVGEFSVADLAAFNELDQLVAPGFEIGQYPAVVQWMQRIEAIPVVAESRTEHLEFTGLYLT